jgi:hypothetical protein
VLEEKEGRQESLPDTVSIIHQEEERFVRFITILYNNYVKRDIEAVRLSTLGVLMRENFVYSEKAGLKPLVERSVQLFLCRRQGVQGNAELVMIKKLFDIFIETKSIEAYTKKAGLAPTLPQPQIPESVAQQSGEKNQETAPLATSTLGLFLPLQLNPESADETKEMQTISRPTRPPSK